MTGKFRFFYVKVILLTMVLGLASTSFAGTTSDARNLAKEAYHQIEGNVFNGYEINYALEKLNKAQQLDDNEPYVYLGQSLAILVMGYKMNDWYEEENFKPGSVEQAVSLAKHAYSLDENLPFTLSHLARINILKKNFREAEQLLKLAQTLEPEDFYPWYFNAILYEKKLQLEDAKGLFDKAESLATYSYQHSIVNAHKQHIATLESNGKGEETLLQEEISNFPNSAHAYGNYGGFLLKQGRVDEAIVQLEKAIAISPYPLAECTLAKARKIREGNEGESLGNCR